MSNGGLSNGGLGNGGLANGGLGKGLVGEGKGHNPSDPCNSNRPSVVSGARMSAKAMLLTPDLGEKTSEPSTSIRWSVASSTGSGAEDGDLTVPASVTAPDGVTEETIVQRCAAWACGDNCVLAMGISPGAAPFAPPDVKEASLYTRRRSAAFLRFVR